MTAVSVLPVAGDVLLDARDDGRALRIAWHATQDVFVLSTWRDGRCTSTFQLRRDEAPDLIKTLALGLAQGPSAPASLWTPPVLTSISGGCPGRLRRLRSRLSRLPRMAARAVLTQER